MTLAEKYRPKSLAEVAGHAEVKRRLSLLMGRGIAGRALSFEGPSAHGKTTLARIVAESVADPGWDGNITELDATGLHPSTIKDIEGDLQSFAFGRDERHGRAVIVNECHGLRADTQRQLLVTLERIPTHALWIFTTTTDGARDLFGESDGAAFLSRCVRFDLGADTGIAKAFAERARTIAETEGLGGATLDAYKLALARAKCNLRAVLMDVDAGKFLATA